MPEHHREPHRFACHVTWTGAAFGPTATYADYSRDLRADFDGKPSLGISAAPVFRGDATRQNPEDLLVAALSTCHALSYLALCARAGILVVAYEDDAAGTMTLVDRVMRFTEVVLRPKVTIAAGGDVEKARALHERAHAECFIASSVNFPVRNEPTVVAQAI
jgi:organic hydroperoxide reductase OsmC/OhrA